LNFEDAAASRLVVSFRPEETMRDIQMRFVNNDTHLFAAGFGDRSIRRCSIYDLSPYLSGDATSSADDEKKEEGDEVVKLGEVKFPVDNAVPMIHHDPDTNIVLVSFVGDRRIRLLEIGSDGSLAELMGTYTTTEDVIGFAAMPKKYIDVRTSDVLKCVRLGRTNAEPVIFRVPRKRLEFFQDDIYGGKDAKTRDTEKPLYASSDAYVAAYKAGKKLLSEISGATWIDLRPADMTPLSEAPAEEKSARKADYDAKAADAKAGDAPVSAEQAMEAFGRMAADAPGANRWDAQPIGTEVDEDEWSD
jgi:coronin-7